MLHVAEKINFSIPSSQEYYVRFQWIETIVAHKKEYIVFSLNDSFKQLEYIYIKVAKGQTITSAVKYFINETLGINILYSFNIEDSLLYVTDTENKEFLCCTCDVTIQKQEVVHKVSNLKYSWLTLNQIMDVDAKFTPDSKVFNIKSVLNKIRFIAPYCEVINAELIARVLQATCEKEKTPSQQEIDDDYEPDDLQKLVDDGWFDRSFFIRYKGLENSEIEIHFQADYPHTVWVTDNSGSITFSNITNISYLPELTFESRSKHHLSRLVLDGTGSFTLEHGLPPQTYR